MAAGDKKYFELDFTDHIEDDDLVAIGRGNAENGTLATTSKILADYIGTTPFNGNRAVTRVIPNVFGINPGTNNVVDFLEAIFYPVVQPTGAISIASPVREVGGSTSYTITWNVVKNSNPITAIHVDGTSISPTGNNQSGTQPGSVGLASGTYSKILLIDDGVTGQVSINTTLTYLLNIFFGTVTTAPTNSAAVRALANSQFTNVGNAFTINTGNVKDIFCFAIPSAMSLVSVIDADALNLDITSFYIMSTITVNDAGGNPQSYKLYTMTNAIPYTTNHRHIVTIQ